jgi:hypothetical protein
VRNYLSAIQYDYRGGSGLSGFGGGDDHRHRHIKMSIFAGVISIIDWLKDKLPIQDRKERWRNQIDDLKKERAMLLKGKADAKKVKRVVAIDKQLAHLEQLCANQE